MSEVKMFKIEEKFNSTEDLYRYLIKNIDFISKSIGIQIQEPLKDNLFCITGKEKITERNILFFASKREFPDNLGELVGLAGAFDADIVVYFLSKICLTQVEVLNWLQKISNEDVQFIVGEAEF